MVVVVDAEFDVAETVATKQGHHVLQADLRPTPAAAGDIVIEFSDEVRVIGFG